MFSPQQEIAIEHKSSLGHPGKALGFGKLDKAVVVPMNTEPDKRDCAGMFASRFQSTIMAPRPLQLNLQEKTI
jgi:hypothetical protein